MVERADAGGRPTVVVDPPGAVISTAVSNARG